jgi:hypothetical protein
MGLEWRLDLWRLGFLSAVATAGLFAAVDAEGIAATTDHLIADTGQVANAAAADKNNRVFLQIVSFAGDVNSDFFGVAQTHAGDFSKSRIRLLGSHGPDDQANALLLRATFQDGALGALALNDAIATDQLIDGWHTFVAKKLSTGTGSTKGGSRTHTSLRTLDFESSASAIPPLWLHFDAVCE